MSRFGSIYKECSVEFDEDEEETICHVVSRLPEFSLKTLKKLLFGESLAFRNVEK